MKVIYLCRDDITTFTPTQNSALLQSISHSVKYRTILIYLFEFQKPMRHNWKSLAAHQFAIANSSKTTAQMDASAITYYILIIIKPDFYLTSILASNPNFNINLGSSWLMSIICFFGQ